MLPRFSADAGGQDGKRCTAHAARDRWRQGPRRLQEGFGTVFQHTIATAPIIKSRTTILLSTSGPLRSAQRAKSPTIKAAFRAMVLSTDRIWDCCAYGNSITSLSADSFRARSSSEWPTTCAGLCGSFGLNINSYAGVLNQHRSFFVRAYAARFVESTGIRQPMI